MIPRLGRSTGEGIGYPFQYSGGSAGKESACNMGDPSSIPGLGRSPGEGEWLPTPVFLPGEFRGQEPGGLHGVEKSSTWLNN